MLIVRRFFYHHFSIIYRYLLREFMTNLLAVTAVLWLIFVATRFARYLAQAAVGNLPGDVILSLLGYSSLSALTGILPIASFLAVMLALGRLNSDNELTVIAACGVPTKRLVRNVFAFSLTIAMFIAYLSLWVVPDVLSNRSVIEKKAKVSADTTGLIAGSFKESRGGDWTFYSQGLSNDGLSMNNIFIEIKRETQPLVFRAERGHFHVEPATGDKYLVLEDGYRYEGKAGQQNFTIVHYDTHQVLIEKGEAAKASQRHKTLPTSRLLERGSDYDWAELHWRIALALMTIILCLSAIKLADTGPRKGRYAGFFRAVLAYILYSNLLGVTKTWIAKSVLPIWFGLLWVHVLVIAILLAFTYRRQIMSRLNIDNKKGKPAV
jgi:lipopolysaccharide export system permease protein